MPTTEAALNDLLAELKAKDYAFTTPTPTTHARVIARGAKAQARDLRDVFGWSLPFGEGLVSAKLVSALRAAGVVQPVAGLGSEPLWRSSVRVSSCGDDLFVHSAYPTTAHDAVFFGPDSYRFAAFIRGELGAVAPGSRIVDIGTGSGVGAIVAARLGTEARVIGTDINPVALSFAAINARFAGVPPELVLSDNLTSVSAVDVALANPPFIIDDAHRAYRDGGALHGGAVSLHMAEMALERLSPQGRLLLYTGSAIVDGADPLREALTELAASRGFYVRYREIDPDVFGEELEREAYAQVERIAIVGAVVTRAA